MRKVRCFSCRRKLLSKFFTVRVLIWVSNGLRPDVHRPREGRKKKKDKLSRRRVSEIKAVDTAGRGAPSPRRARSPPASRWSSRTLTFDLSQQPAGPAWVDWPASGSARRVAHPGWRHLEGVLRPCGLHRKTQDSAATQPRNQSLKNIFGGHFDAYSKITRKPRNAFLSRSQMAFKIFFQTLWFLGCVAAESGFWSFCVSIKYVMLEGTGVGGWGYHQYA